MEIRKDISDSIHRIPCTECGETILVSDDDIKSKGVVKCDKCGHEQLLVKSKKDKNE